MATSQLDTRDYVVPLSMNNLQGRMLRLQGKKAREILVVYDAPTTLEHVFGLAESLQSFGNVTIPDLPGFGGMQSFYKLHEKPTIDALADYLAAFVKLQYKRRRITIIGLSYGFVVTTRMLQKYPELAKKVDDVISMFGYVHQEDFIFTRNRFVLGAVTRFYSFRLPAGLVQALLLNRPVLNNWYRLKAERRTKLLGAPPSSPKLAVALWHKNDFRTRMFTDHCKLHMDLCNQRVALPVYHLTVQDDQQLNNQIIEQHLGVIFDHVSVIPTTLQHYAPKLMNTTERVKPLLPPKLKRILR